MPRPKNSTPPAVLHRSHHLIHIAPAVPGTHRALIPSFRSIILGAVGLPLEGVAIILAVDRVLDMFRAMVNVLSDSCGAVIVAKLDGEEVLVSRSARLAVGG